MFKTTQPFFSIVIPTYNRAADLQFALYCIFKQTFTDFEVVVSDNCSSDHTKYVIEKLKNKKIRYFRNSKNVNFVHNVRLGLQRARGRYIFFHSDDDFLLQSDVLSNVHKEIVNHGVGYIRVNYLCFSPGKKRIFRFKVNSPFEKNRYLLPHHDNEGVVEFLLHADPYFFTGIVFRNNFPKQVQVVEADPFAWVGLAFYSAKKYGACFMSTPQIVASWSQWHNTNKGENPLYSVLHGKLKAEKFFEEIQSKLPDEAYRKFLHEQLMLIYVSMFPAIKVMTSNATLLKLAKRIRALDPAMGRVPMFRIYLMASHLLPKALLRIVKNTYLDLYTKFSKVDNEKQVLRRIQKLNTSFRKRFIFAPQLPQ